MRWIKDSEFIRGDIPMTKFEVRLISIGLLGIENGDVLLDIGAGTGSVSVPVIYGNFFILQVL